MDTLYIVVPCYNETEVLRETTKRLTDKLDRMHAAGLISDRSRIMYVDDGSSDGTWQLIEELHKKNPIVEGVKLSRNRGHQNALLAGLMTAKDRADCVISMDADLQDDIEVIDEFVRQYDDGCDIVYGVRSSRASDTGFKRSTAQMFYRLMDKLGVETVYNHADYRLMSARALDGLAEFDEVNLFLRGIVPQIGYKTGQVEYERGERYAGESKYPLKKMLAFAGDGITSFSTKPISIIAMLGLVLMLAATAAAVWGIVAAIAGHPYDVVGWAIVSIWGATGLLLAGLGVVGTYVGKAYMETKRRPRYIIEQVLDDKAKASV